MRKLFKLREWLTIDEAARHLTIVLGEEVAPADVLRLGLDGHLNLSANFVNHARAHLGRVVPYKDVPKMEMPPIRSDGMPGSETFTFPRGLLIDPVDKLTDDTPFVCFDKAAISIDGIWDLAMKGGEAIEVEHRFQELTDGPPVELTNIDGSFVCRSDGQWAQLLAQFEDKEVETPTGRKKVRGSYYPMSGLPDDAVLVVRTAALTDFQERLAQPTVGRSLGDGQLSTRERDTLLKLVIGMAVEAYRHDPDAARSPTPGEIAADLEKHGLSMTDDTVRKYLKEAATTVLPKRSKA